MRVKFWDWDHRGQEVLFVGTVVGEFTDPEERYARPSYGVRLDDGGYKTPYADECREIQYA